MVVVLSRALPLIVWTRVKRSSFGCDKMSWISWINFFAGIFIGIIIGASYVASKDKSVEAILNEAKEVEILMDLSDLR